MSVAHDVRQPSPPAASRADSAVVPRDARAGDSLEPRGSQPAAGRWSATAVAVALSLTVGSAAWSAAPRFYPDDPIWSDDDRAVDASKVGADRGHQRLRLRGQHLH